MCGKNDIRVCAIVFGLAACLLVSACLTCQEKETEADAATASSDAVRDVVRRLNEIIIPEMTLYPPATIIDAVDLLQQVSRDYDKAGTPSERQGFRCVVKLPRETTHGTRELVDPFAEGASTNGVPPLHGAIAVRDISLYDALRLVCDLTDMRWHISEKGGVMLVPKGWDMEEDWVTRSFDIPQSLYDQLFGNRVGRVKDGDANKVWQTFFNDLGVTGPEFEWFEHQPAINKLRVTNTPEKLAFIEWFFESFAARMIEVEVQIHVFRTQDVERLRLAGGVSVESLMALRQQGKGRPVATATALTKSGQEAVVKAVREVLYPTELLAQYDQTGSNVVSQSAAKALIPGNLEMRETGMTLQVVPEVMANGELVNVMLNLTWVTLEGWDSYPAILAAGWTHKTLALKQPVFGATSFQTLVRVEDGETVLLGSCSTPDGLGVNVGFLTVRLRDAQPEVSGGKSVKARQKRGTGRIRPPSDERSAAVGRKMRDTTIPEMTFRPPTTIVDAVRFFKEASISHDNAEVPEAQRGVNFVLKLPVTRCGQPETVTNADLFAATDVAANAGAPVISALSARFINLYDALKLVCDVTGMKFRIRDGIVQIVPMGDPEDELIMRVYPVQPAMCERMIMEDCSRGGEDKGQDWKDFFAKLGVCWPEGSSVSYLASRGLLSVTNTPDNLEVFEQVLKELAVLPVMIEVGVQIHAFRPEDVEPLRVSNGMTVETLTALRKSGKGKPVASATVLTKSGQEAVMKSVREILYPTEQGLDGGAGALVPRNFEMREVGMILQVVPESTAEQALINVMLLPQWVTLDRWDTFPSELAAGWAHKTLPFRQPVFGATSFQTQAAVENGGTVLLGSCSTPDGKGVHVGFLTVRLFYVQAEASRGQQ